MYSHRILFSTNIRIQHYCFNNNTLDKVTSNIKTSTIYIEIKTTFEKNVIGKNNRM